MEILRLCKAHFPPKSYATRLWVMKHDRIKVLCASVNMEFGFDFDSCPVDFNSMEAQ